MIGNSLAMREAQNRMKAAIENGTETVSRDQLFNRLTHCYFCEIFNGVICNEIGCSTNLSNRNRYFALVLDPREKCPFRQDGFPIATDF